MIKLAPSLLAANFTILGEQIKEIEACKADWLHLDVMDGHFVPNISFGVPVIASLRKLTKIPFDVHLMIEEPSRFVDEFVKAGADIITVHYEAERHLDRTINLIKSYGKKAGVALNPSTPVSVLENVIKEVDMVLIMSVNPGFGGQSFINYSHDKLAELKELAKNKHKELLIQVDGGIDCSNIAKIVESGANVIVAGSSVFKDGAVRNNLSLLREEIK